MVRIKKRLLKVKMQVLKIKKQVLQSAKTAETQRTRKEVRKVYGRIMNGVNNN